MIKWKMHFEWKLTYLSGMGAIVNFQSSRSLETGSTSSIFTNMLLLGFWRFCSFLLSSGRVANFSTENPGQMCSVYARIDIDNVIDIDR